MAKKRSVRVEETENKARVEIRRAWLSLPPGGYYGDMPTPGDFYRLKRQRIPDYILFMLGGTSLQNAVRHSGKHDERNLRITRCVEYAINAGLKATRNRDQRHTNGAHSACSLVADELTAEGILLSEDAVEKIWRQHPVYRIGS